LSTSNNEQRAVLAALEMVEKAKSLNEKYHQQFKRSIQMGIGINAGDVVAGNLGSEEKIGYSVIGDTVNTAKRLEGLTKDVPNSIVVSESVYTKVAPIVQVEAIPSLFLKGKKTEMRPYRILNKK
jgi:class 3 adenylate cyclase